jgi:hypothetical protein
MQTTDIDKYSWAFPIAPEDDADVREVIDAIKELSPDRAGIDTLLALSAFLGTVVQAMIKEGHDKKKLVGLIEETIAINSNPKLNEAGGGDTGWFKR